MPKDKFFQTLATSSLYHDLLEALHRTVPVDTPDDEAQALRQWAMLQTCLHDSDVKRAFMAWIYYDIRTAEGLPVL